METLQFRPNVLSDISWCLVITHFC